jgi:hypothetical protein
MEGGKLQRGLADRAKPLGSAYDPLPQIHLYRCRRDDIPVQLQALISTQQHALRNFLAPHLPQNLPQAEPDREGRRRIPAGYRGWQICGKSSGFRAFMKRKQHLSH